MKTIAATNVQYPGIIQVNSCSGSTILWPQEKSVIVFYKQPHNLSWKN